MKLMKTLKALSRLPEIVDRLDGLDDRMDMKLAANSAKIIAEVRDGYVSNEELDDALEEKRKEMMDDIREEFVTESELPDTDDFITRDDFDPDDFDLVTNGDLPCNPDELAEADSVNERIDGLENEIREFGERFSDDAVGKARSEAERTISFFTKLNEALRTGLKSALEESKIAKEEE